MTNYSLFKEEGVGGGVRMKKGRGRAVKGDPILYTLFHLNSIVSFQKEHLIFLKHHNDRLQLNIKLEVFFCCF